MCRAGRASIIKDLLKRFSAGDRAACARLISLVENESIHTPAIFNAVYSRVGRAHRVGITGPPGAGKSTIVEKITVRLREKGRSVAVIAVDPTSPFTGGAILGDRVRMSNLFCDPEVFIRSMATRGSSGGLASRTREVCDLMDAFGKEVILIETIGVGQAELDVANTAQTTVIVLVPESGDGIQAMKAGLMEIGDLFVVNKSDREGADRLMTEIRMMLDLRPREEGWQPEVMKTTASQGEGVERLVEEIGRHRTFLADRRMLLNHRKENIRREMIRLAESRLATRFWKIKGMSAMADRLVDEIADGQMSPYQAIDRLFQNNAGGEGTQPDKETPNHG